MILASFQSICNNLTEGNKPNYCIACLVDPENIKED